MKAFYTLFILIIPFVGFGQLTYVPDDNFEQALIDLGYDDILDNYVQTSNITYISELDLYFVSNISSLTGIEDFVSLTSLKCRYNQITSLDLSNNSLLTLVDCSNNQINGISFDNNNNVIEELNCSGNNLSNLSILQDFGTIPNNSLKHLNIEDNIFENFNFTIYAALEYLYIGKNKFKNIDLSSNVNLKQFSSYDVYNGDIPNDYFNQINSISFFNNSNIETITITNGYLPDSNKVHTIILPYEAEDLTSINLFNNLIECLDVSMYPNLQSISLGNNQLSQLNLQNGNQNLTPVINNNNLSCVKVTNLGIANSWNGVDSFTTFSLDCNTNYNCHQKTFVPDDNFEEFLESNGYGNGIENDDSVYTANISSIHSLYINSLGIYDLIGIEDFTYLHWLWAEENSISNIDLSNNINLEWLWLGGNQLSNLDLSNNVNLKWLNAYNTQLSSLDLSNNFLLSSVRVSNNNELLSLDLRNSNNQNLNNLGTLYCPNLTCINVDDENFSNINWTENPFTFDNNHYFSNNCNWSCVNNVCVDPMDGSGEYGSLNDCEANCSVAIEDSWNCVNNVCVDPMDGSGIYSSLNDCEANCSVVIEDSWNCVNDACIDPMDGSGVFLTLNDCEQVCQNVSSISETLIDVNIYPNPSSNIFNLEFNSDSETEILVTNILGEQVYIESTQSSGEFNTQIDLSNYSKGIYNLTIKTSDGISNHKLILQ